MEVDLKSAGTLVKIVGGLIGIATTAVMLTLYLSTGPELEEDFDTFKEREYDVHVVASDERIDDIEDRLNESSEREYREWKQKQAEQERRNSQQRRKGPPPTYPRNKQQRRPNH